MVYTIWDTESANLVDSFTSEQAALEEVRLSVKALGREAVLSWALAARDPSGQRFAIASGEELIRRAFAVPA